jgi:hypothetical protein
MSIILKPIEFILEGAVKNSFSRGILTYARTTKLINAALHGAALKGGSDWGYEKSKVVVDAAKDSRDVMSIFSGKPSLLITEDKIKPASLESTTQGNIFAKTNMATKRTEFVSLPLATVNELYNKNEFKFLDDKGIAFTGIQIRPEVLDLGWDANSWMMKKRGKWTSTDSLLKYADYLRKYKSSRDDKQRYKYSSKIEHLISENKQKLNDQYNNLGYYDRFTMSAPESFIGHSANLKHAIMNAKNAAVFKQQQEETAKNLRQ